MFYNRMTNTKIKDQALKPLYAYQNCIIHSIRHILILHPNKICHTILLNRKILTGRQT